jgi:phosphatidylinositol alpha-mannosyltransferase
MKILFVSDTFYPHTGGVPEHIFYLCNMLRSMGHDARILAPSYGNNEPWVSDHIIRLGRAIMIPKNRSFSVLTFGILIPWKLRRLLEKENFDVIHLHGSVAPTLPYLALKYSKAKNFITFHSAHEQSYGYVLWEPVLEQYFRKLDGLIAVSVVARDSVSKYFPGEYRIIPNGIDTERFRPGLKHIEELAHFSPKILFVGRFEPRKGLKYLLQAFPRILREIPDAKLVVVGQGFLERYYRRYVEEHIKGSVFFVGHVSPEDLPRYYASCDVYCSPATGAESFGIVLLEAMATETPITCSDIPGYRTLMAEGKEGLFFRACDPAALAEKMLYLLKNRNKMKEMGKMGRVKAVTYDWKRVAKEVLEFYCEVLNKTS